MAMSAFRSTTRRGCQFGSGNASSAEGSGGVPSTPRSKRDPSPSGRGFHRRSTSMSDFSAKYLSDCSSTSEFRTSSNRRSGTKTGRHSVCPSDTESDMESLSMHRRHRRLGVESEDEMPLNPSASGMNVKEADQKGLRRTLSSQDLSQNINKMRNPVPVIGRKLEIDDTEDLAEEKTIRAVYAQMKSLHSDPPAGDVGTMDFLEAMRTEVRRAVADIRMELEESMQKNGKLSTTMDEKNRSQPHGANVIQAVADIRQEYTTKLEESEKKVRELWSQIAVEERRCLELSKIVKELLPTQPPVIMQSSTLHSSASRRRPVRRKNSAEKQLSLDDEALKYFEECVSISSYDCQGDSDDSLREKENNGKPRSGRMINEEITAKSPSRENDCKSETQSKSSIGSDGVVLPWLQWEAEAGGSDKNSKQVAKKNGIGKGTSLSNRLASRKLATRPSTELGHALPDTAPVVSTCNQEGACDTTANVSELRKPETCQYRTPCFMVDENVIQTDNYFADVDTLLFERIRFKCRVENGELLLCQGLFLV